MPLFFNSVLAMSQKGHCTLLQTMVFFDSIDMFVLYTI
jgi:hypothetical protein